MTNCNIHTNLESQDDVYNFRTKIYEVVNRISNREIYASRISSALSSFIANAMKKKESCTVETDLNIIKDQVQLRFLFHGIMEQLPFLDMFFDQVKHENNQCSLFKYFPLFADIENQIEQAHSILTQKSKEELAREIRAKNAELQQSIEDLKKTNTEKSRMENELNVAQSIQLSMLPLEFPAFSHRSDIDVYANLIPAREVGGDFYDFFFLDEVYMGLVVGDVSGKGVPAALMMAVCKTLLKSRASTDRSTASILTHVNNEMAKDNKNYMFVTVFMAVLNTRTGELIFTNAGHNPTFIKKHNGEIVKLTTLHGPVIAAMEGITYGETKVQIDPGDTIFAYTDGITEAHNPEGELFSDSRLNNLIMAKDYKDAEDMVKSIIKETKAFEGGQEQFDDITALCLQYKGSDMMIEKKEILILNDLEQVQTVIEEFELFAEEHQVPFPMVMKINIVLDEIVSNIIKYGFPEENKDNLEIVIELQGKKMRLIIQDRGIPFNPFQKTPPDLSKPLEEREIGGLGIHLVRQLMDEYEYNRQIDRNVVVMTKYAIF